MTTKTAAVLTGPPPITAAGLIKGPLHLGVNEMAGKRKTDDDNGPVECVCLSAFVLAPGEQAEAGEIITFERKDFNIFTGMKRVREATADDIKRRKAVLKARADAEKD